MTGLIARVPRARTTLILALSFLLLAFAANVSAQRVQPHRTAQAHAHPHKKAVKKKPHRKHKAVKHRRPSAKHQTIKRHAAPAPHRRAKRTNAVRPRPAAAKPRLMASCGYSPRAVNTLHSRAAYVLDVDSGTPLLARNARTVRPIASISKLMTAMVVLDSKAPMADQIEVTDEDRDYEKGTGSRLSVGSVLSREDMLHIALMASENRAAAALSRYYPGGRPAFIAAMNAKAKSLGMTDTHFENSTGLSSSNVSSARDLVKMVNAAYQYPMIRQFSTDRSYEVYTGKRNLAYNSTNALIRGNGSWDIGLQKTGFINEAGECLVMQATIHGRPMVMVLLDSFGKYSRFADAARLRNWLDAGGGERLTAANTPNGGT